MLVQARVLFSDSVCAAAPQAVCALFFSRLAGLTALRSCGLVRSSFDSARKPVCAWQRRRQPAALIMRVCQESDGL